MCLYASNWSKYCTISLPFCCPLPTHVESDLPSHIPCYPLAQCEKNHLPLQLDAVVGLTQPLVPMDRVPLSAEGNSLPLTPPPSKALANRQLELLRMSGYGPMGELHSHCSDAEGTLFAKHNPQPPPPMLEKQCLLYLCELLCQIYQ